MTDRELSIVKLVLLDSARLSTADADALTAEIVRRCQLDERAVAAAELGVHVSQVHVSRGEVSLSRRAKAMFEQHICMAEFNHIEGPVICGNPLPCSTHGGGK